MRNARKRLIALAIAIAANWVVPARSAAPMVKTQPGFFRMMLGDFEITALNDGVVSYQTKRVFPDATPDRIKDALFEASLTDPVGMSYNAFLINTGDKLVLIDTGTGGKLDDEPEFHGAGRLIENLRAAGYRPEQIDEVYITHRGQDHIGGLTIGTGRAFPNAVVRAPRSEFDIFLDPAKAAAFLAQSHGNEKVRSWLQFTGELFEPYVKVGKFESFDGEVDLVPGIRTLATHGHTPGHTSYVVTSKGQTMIVMGDLVLLEAVHFRDPMLSSTFDADHGEAAAQRKRVLRMAVDQGCWVAGAHISFPGIGHVRFDQNRYRWNAVSYTIP